MAKDKKYTLIVNEIDGLWQAQITRQVTSKKRHTSKEKSGFSSEAEALEWGEKELVNFSSTLNKSNQRHTQQRNANMEVRRQRAARRADKTEQAKLVKAETEDSTSATETAPENEI